MHMMIRTTISFITWLSLKFEIWKVNAHGAFRGDPSAMGGGGILHNFIDHTLFAFSY